MSGDYRGGHDIRERAFEFACRVVRFCQRLYDAGGVARVMAPQLLNCSTAIFAMLEEAPCKTGPTDEALALLNEANALVAIIGTIVSNARANADVPRSAATRRRPILNLDPHRDPDRER